MDFLKSKKRFSLKYGEKSIWDCEFTVSEKEDGNSLITEYAFPDGLKITNTAKKYDDFGAYEWVTYFENTSDRPTDIISELWDADIELPFSAAVFKNSAYLPDYDKEPIIYHPIGSIAKIEDFSMEPDGLEICNYRKHLYQDQTKTFKTSGGRSSESEAPFFNVKGENGGTVFAIGWSGQWNCEISRKTDTINIRTKIEDTNFRLLPGEKFRTSSFVMMPYEGGFTDSQNKWRRLVKKHFSLIGKPGRDKYGPLFCGIWGGLKSEQVLERIEFIKKNNIPFEYLWMDAGWYGRSKKDSPNEFTGDWGDQVGDWRVNNLVHPDGLRDVSEAIKNAGMKFLLWFEPERTMYTAPEALAHPEYFLRSSEGDWPAILNPKDLLLNLGNEDAWNYCFNLLSDYIEKLNISCYRQDFNMKPLAYWRSNDAFDRKGISEIKHINGMYRLWDKLLEKFPNLIIDNCASGGRRIDIETLRRSIPLWRSDYQCTADYKPESNQYQSITYGIWAPFAGTGTGRAIGDTYRIRSAYAPALTTNYLFSVDEKLPTDKETIDWLKKYCSEYKTVRPYLSCDMYPLTNATYDTEAYMAVQYDNPEGKDGIIQIFRRENSPYPSIMLKPEALSGDKKYIITDADSGEKFTICGKDEFEIKIPEKRTAKLYFYKELK